MSIIITPNYNVDYQLAVSRGVVTGAEVFGAYGKLVTSGAVTHQLIWPDGTFNVPSSSGVQMTLVSTSAQDGVAGTGIRSVHMHYLDANLIPQSETITLNGLTPVTSVATNVRFIQCLHLATYGSGKAAAGTITATNAGLIYSQISTGALRCSSSARMVPSGKRLIVSGLSGGSSSGTAAASSTVSICSTILDTHDYTADAILIQYATAAVQDNNTTLSLNPPLSFPQGVVVAMTASTDKAATIVGSWFGWLENV